MQILDLTNTISDESHLKTYYCGSVSIGRKQQRRRKVRKVNESIQFRELIICRKARHTNVVTALVLATIYS